MIYVKLLTVESPRIPYNKILLFHSFKFIGHPIALDLAGVQNKTVRNKINRQFRLKLLTNPQNKIGLLNNDKHQPQNPSQVFNPLLNPRREGSLSLGGFCSGMWRPQQAYFLDPTTWHN